jgi:hypothetical protein
MGRSVIPGIVFWALFFPFAAVEFMKPDWYTDWTRADWLNLGVAVGTLALAGITAWNALVTRAIIGAEDRRHQQSLAPIVNLWPHITPSGTCILNVVNMGPGPAINADIECIASFYEGRQERLHTIRYRWNVLSASQGNHQRIPVDLHDLEGRPKIVSVPSMHIRYHDMFGNVYDSHRTDKTFSWMPPERLR